MVAGVAVTCAAAYGFVFVPDFVRLVDNQAYFLLGKGLVEGKGYVDYWSGEPIPPHTHFPPGFPVLLAAAMRIGITSIVGLKLFNGMLLAVGVGLTAVWTRQVFNKEALALWVMAAVGLNAAVLLYGSLLMSEVAFLTISVGALMCALRTGATEGDKPVWANGMLYLLLLLLVSSFYIRTVGVALIAGCVGGMLLDGRRKQAAVLALGSAAGIAPWVLFVHRAGKSSYLDYLDAAGTGTEPAQNPLLWRLVGNATEYAGSVFPSTIVPGLALAIELYAGLGWAVTGVLVVLGGWGLAHAGRHKAVVAAYLGCTAYILLLWPYVTERFLVPLVPIVTALALRGLWEAGGRYVQSRAFAPFVLGLLLLLSLPALRAGRDYAAEPRAAEVRYEQMAAAVMREAQPGDRVATRYPGSMYYMTGMPSRAFPIYSSSLLTMTYLESKELDLLVVTADGSNDPAFRVLASVVRDYPGRFVLLESVAKPLGQPPLDYPHSAALYRFVESPSSQIPEPPPAP